MAFLVVLNISQLLSFQHIITIKLINEIFYILFFGVKSLKSGMHFILMAHFSSVFL